jgi:prepilin-type N-terminal cleavage/methylation domain-containing protein
LRNARREGFTLIEMSMVLVIIGLIVGGMMVGQNLIRAANVRGAISELDKIKVAVTAFRTKYDCLPGDCGNITTFFPQDASCPSPTGKINATTTCNGNGNGTIDGLENTFFFQHLSLAGMIDEQMALPDSTGIPHFVSGDISGIHYYQSSYASHYYSSENGNVSVPGPFKNAGYSVVDLLGSSWWLGFLAGAGGKMPANFAFNAYQLGGDGNNTQNYVPVMSTADAYAIDTKIDDGMPGTGNVQVYKDIGNYWPSNNFPYCYTSTVASTAQYNLSASGNICSLWFTTGF